MAGRISGALGLIALIIGAALPFAGCGDEAASKDGTGGAPPARQVDETTPGSGSANAPGEAPFEDPFAPQPDESEGLTNVSSDLQAILERGALSGACARYRAGQTDRKTMLLCGKWMFFYETFGTSGVPAAIVKFLAANFPDELGLGFSRLGMVPDPSSTENMPLGLAPSVPLKGNIEAVAFTCASCHFAQLPDQRFAVGAPNHRYDYGTQILSIVLAPSLGMGLGSAAKHDSMALTKVQPVLDKLSSSLTLRGKFGLKLLSLATADRPSMTREVERAYASWETGTLDFVMAPLPVEDNVNVVGKIIGLWSIPRPEEVARSKMSNALLAWTGSARSLEEFLRGFASLGGAATTPSDAEFRPLIEYLYSLRAPNNPKPPPASEVATGASLFRTKGCATCHDGPSGSGKRAYAIDEVGTDPAVAKWLDPTLSGNACCGVDVDPGTLTHGVKSPRLVGMWALGRFLHNGSLSSLEQLFCLSARPSGYEPQSSAGHMFTCDGLAESEKRALIAYLLAH